MNQAQLEEAFTFHEKLVNAATRFTGSFFDAEDIVQDVYLHLAGDHKPFEGRSSLWTYLYRCMINTALMRHRKLKRRIETLDAAGFLSLDRAELSHESSVIVGIDLERALASLALGYRTAILCHDQEGYEHTEMGQYGWSAGTSKSQLHKARKRTREALAGY